ncbi:MAG TPA: hypothetical protein VF021_10080 [Longimicrobiales bacterium]
MEVLFHTQDDCTGNWRLIGSGETRQIRCDRCASQFSATPENRLAAIDENYAGIYLRRLTAEGITHLDSER